MHVQHQRRNHLAQAASSLRLGAPSGSWCDLFKRRPTDTPWQNLTMDGHLTK